MASGVQRNCPHCGTPVQLIAKESDPTLYCSKCKTHLHIKSHDYTYEDDAPDYIKDSFACVTFVHEHQQTIVMSKSQLFQPGFHFRDLFIADPMSGRVISESRIKQIANEEYHLIGIGGAVAYGAMAIMKEMLRTGNVMQPVARNLRCTTGQFLFIPVMTKLINSKDKNPHEFDHVIDQFYRITLEGKLRSSFDIWRTGHMSPMRDEYMLLSTVLLDPYTVIGTPTSPDAITEKVHKFVRAYTNVTTVREEPVAVALRDDHLCAEYLQMYLHSMPSILINESNDGTCVNFDIYEHCTYKIQSVPGNALSVMSTIGYYKIMNILCKMYIGQELTSFGLAGKRAYLCSCGLLDTMTDEEVVRRFWNEVDKKINGVNSEVYEIM